MFETRQSKWNRKRPQKSPEKRKEYWQSANRVDYLGLDKCIDLIAIETAGKRDLECDLEFKLSIEAKEPLDVTIGVLPGVISPHFTMQLCNTHS